MHHDDALSYEARMLRDHWLYDRKGRVLGVSEMILDCDEFRRNYDQWTVADHKRFYSAVWAQYPSQSHSAPLIVATIISVHKPCTVVEIGGWDGELAVTMLDQFPFIDRWTNVEICEEAVEHGHRHERYYPVSPDRWYWEQAWKADLFVASHCIEHMSARDLEKMVGATDAARLFFDAPLQDAPTNWWGSSTTHCLEVGWDGVTEICARHGYDLAWSSNHVTAPESGGAARACVYERQLGVMAA
jgi:hypothetical protein